MTTHDHRDSTHNDQGVSRRRAAALALGAAILLAGATPLHAQGPPRRAAVPDGYPVPEAILGGFDFRMVGPARGGRVTTVTGIPDQPHVFYMGSTGGGVWKTVNAGMSWTNVSDDAFAVGSIGAVVVAPSDPNRIYVGTGSACPRGNISVGNGIYRSTDGARSFEHIGLPDAGLIGRIVVDPRDPDRLYVAVLGQIFGPSPERGVYRSTDGGDTWEAVFQISDTVGAVELVMNPGNSRELFAAMWRVGRKPWTLVDGGPEGGLFRTRDGGESWEPVGGGFPQAAEGAPLGRIGISMAASDPRRMYALVTAEEDRGGLWRSEDGGDTWTRINGDRRLRGRGWYYSHVVADPTDANTVYVLNAPFFKSIDGGRSFETVRVPHGDNHDLWINPNDARIMVEANDGGATVTLDGGATWSSIHNQPTAEFYRLTVDDAFPRRLYGAQQDNSTISVPAWTDSGLSPEAHWLDVAGGESGHIAVTPGRPELTYAGNYIGQIDRYDRASAGARNVILYPQLADGVAPRDLRYRFQWNAPILVSVHDPEVVFHTSNYVHRTTDGGMNWETISPDLTANDAEKQELPGGPVQFDHTGVEVYGTVFSLAESPHDPRVLWVGTDDGRVHLSRDGGASWSEITPPGMPPGGTVNSIDVSWTRPGSAVLAVQRYRENDFEPWVFRTMDHGVTWARLGADGGIPAGHPARVVREDPTDERILYLGTEFALFLSLDGGERFVPFGDLPATPITDLQVAGDELLVATQGRSFWVLDDLTPVRALEARFSGEAPDAPMLFPAGDAVRLATGGSRPFREPGAPENRPSGALLHYFLPEDLPPEAELTLTIRDESGEALREVAAKPDPGAAPETEAEDADDRAEAVLEREAGLHVFAWDLRFRRPELQQGSVMSISYTGGAAVPPGRYTASLVFASGDDEPVASPDVAFSVHPDPRHPASLDDLLAQHTAVREAQSLLERIHRGIGNLRDARAQLEATRERGKKADRWSDDLDAGSESLLDELKAIEDELIQTRSEAGQDPVNFPPKLDNQVAYLYGHIAQNYGPPTTGSLERLADLQAEAEAPLGRLAAALGPTLASLNAAFAEAGLTAVFAAP